MHLSGSDGKASVYNTGDLSLIPVSGRFPGEGNGNPLQYTCLENPMDAGAWYQATAHGVAKSLTWLSDFTSLSWEKVSFHSNPKKGNAKEYSNYHTIVLISHAGKVMLKILSDRLQQCMNRELPDVQAGFRKGRGTGDQIANTHWIIEKAREFQKNIYFWFIDYAKAFDCVDHNKLWNILKEMGLPDHLICLLRNLYASW